MVLFEYFLIFVCSSKELSSHEPMDTGKSTEKTTNKRYSSPYNRFYFLILLLPVTFRKPILDQNIFFLQCSREKEDTRRTCATRKHPGERERVCI